MKRNTISFPMNVGQQKLWYYLLFLKLSLDDLALNC